MEQQTTAKVDRQATGLLDISFWSNIVVMVLIIGITAVNFFRAQTAQGALLSNASPELVLIVSAALVLYLGYGCFTVMTTKLRLNQAYISIDQAGVSGCSLEKPMMREPGEPFTAAFGEIRSVSIVGVPITKKHVAASLKIETADRSYVVPAPEGLHDLVNTLSERMTGGAAED